MSETCLTCGGKIFWGVSQSAGTVFPKIMWHDCKCLSDILDEWSIITVVDVDNKWPLFSTETITITTGDE